MGSTKLELGEYIAVRRLQTAFSKECASHATCCEASTAWALAKVEQGLLIFGTDLRTEASFKNHLFLERIVYSQFGPSYQPLPLSLLARISEHAPGS